MLNDEVSEGAAEVEGLEYGVGVARVERGMCQLRWRWEGVGDGPGVAKLREGSMRWSGRVRGARTFSSPNCFPSAVHGIGAGFGSGVSETAGTGWVKGIHLPMGISESPVDAGGRTAGEGEGVGSELGWREGLWTCRIRASAGAH